VGVYWDEPGGSRSGSTLALFGAGDSLGVADTAGIAASAFLFKEIWLSIAGAEIIIPDLELTYGQYINKK
jgi:hypothetical protein